MPLQHLLVIDPAAFTGGSKVATENIFLLLYIKRVHITVLTAEPGFTPVTLQALAHLFTACPLWVVV